MPRPKEPQTTFSAEIDFPDFVQLAVPGQAPQAPPALLLHTVPGRRQQATLAALQGLRPEGETVLPAGIQPSKPHCFCIKMTRGSFVDYTRSCLLHCGVSDAAARVYNFDQHGYHLERWREAISVPLEQIGDFDAALRAHDKIHRDRGVPYQDSEHNCYHYAVSFLNHVRYRGRTDHTIQSIERELLTPPCLEAIAYLNKYKKVTSSPRTICCEVDAAGNAARLLTAAELKQHVAAKGLATATSTEDSDSASLETDDDSRTSGDDDIESGRYGRTAAPPRRQQRHGRTHPRGHSPRTLLTLVVVAVQCASAAAGRAWAGLLSCYAVHSGQPGAKPGGAAFAWAGVRRTALVLTSALTQASLGSYN